MQDADPKSLAAHRSPDEVLAHDRELTSQAGWTGGTAALEDESNVRPSPFRRSTHSEAQIIFGLTVTPNGSTRVLPEAGWTGMCPPRPRHPQRPKCTASQSPRFFGPPPVPQRLRPLPASGAQWTACAPSTEAEVLSEDEFNAAVQHALMFGQPMPVDCEQMRCI